MSRFCRLKGAVRSIGAAVTIGAVPGGAALAADDAAFVAARDALAATGECDASAGNTVERFTIAGTSGSPEWTLAVIPCASYVRDTYSAVFAESYDMIKPVAGATPHLATVPDATFQGGDGRAFLSGFRTLRSFSSPQVDAAGATMTSSSSMIDSGTYMFFTDTYRLENGDAVLVRSEIGIEGRDEPIVVFDAESN